MGAPITPSRIPPLGIIPFLTRYEVSWEDFTRRMSRDPELKKLRSAVEVWTEEDRLHGHF